LTPRRSSSEAYLVYLPIDFPIYKTLVKYTTEVGYLENRASITGPSIFSALCEPEPFNPEFDTYDIEWQKVIGSLLKQKPVNIRSVVPDQNNSAYDPKYWYDIDTRDIFNDGRPLRYGLWKKIGEQPYTKGWDDDDPYSYFTFDPTLYEPVPKATTYMSSTKEILKKRTPPVYQTSNNFNTLYSYYIDRVDDRLYSVWDWNDPNYCRSICKQLGFTDQDLVP
jgi:hypothetical protein